MKVHLKYVRRNALCLHFKDGEKAWPLINTAQYRGALYRGATLSDFDCDWSLLERCFEKSSKNAFPCKRYNSGES